MPGSWIERAPNAQTLQEQLNETGAQIAVAKSAADAEALRLLAPRRIALGTELTALLRPMRQAHRAEIRNLFFSRVGNTTATLTYRLRCQAVDDGLGWATANAVLDSALLAWKKSLALGRAPKFAADDRKDQDSLSLQFTTKGGLPAEQLLDGSRMEVYLRPPAVTQRRAYGQFRFRLGLARDGIDATGTWQCHRPLPTGAHVTIVRLIRRRIADKERWALQLVLRLPAAVRIACEQPIEPAALHFGWVAIAGGRRVATMARSADPSAVQTFVLPASIEADLTHSASLQGQRALAKAALLPKLVAHARQKTGLPAPVLAELTSIASMPAQHVATARIYRLQKALADAGQRWPALDAWVREDRKHWQAAVLLARRARGRRRDFYRCLALGIARQHRAVVLEPLDLKAAGRAFHASTGQWSAFSHHARTGRVVAALHELEQAIRWACARCGTAVFELKGLTTSTCAVCGKFGVEAVPETSLRGRCHRCSVEHDRHANAACATWRHTREGFEARMRKHILDSMGHVTNARERVAALKASIAEKRKLGRVEVNLRRKEDPVKR
jgi:hypothetical protein